MPFCWPTPPLHIVLVAPSIPPNTGNISRLCAGTGTVLHLIEPIGFDLSEKSLRRAGLDYWDAVELYRHANLEEFFARHPTGRKYFFSTSGARNCYEATFAPGDFLIFGNETHGLPDELLAAHADDVLNIPIRLDRIRSINLSNSAAIALYEAMRQIHIKNLNT